MSKPHSWNEEMCNYGIDDMLVRVCRDCGAHAHVPDPRLLYLEHYTPWWHEAGAYDESKLSWNCDESKELIVRRLDERRVRQAAKKRKAAKCKFCKGTGKMRET